MKFAGQEMTCVGTEMPAVSTEINGEPAAMSKNRKVMKCNRTEKIRAGAEMSCVNTEIGFASTEMICTGKEIYIVCQEITSASSAIANTF